MQRLRQAQRRDAGLPYVDTIAASVDPLELPVASSLANLTDGNGAAAGRGSSRPDGMEPVSLEQA